MSEPVKIPNKNSKNILSRILDRLNKQDKKIKKLQEHTQAPLNHDVTNHDLFNAMNKNFDRVYDRFSKQDKKFTDINNHFTDINKRFTNVDKRFDHMLYAQMGTIVAIILASITILAK